MMWDLVSATLLAGFCFWDVEGVRLYADSSARAFQHPRSERSACLDSVPDVKVDFEDIPAGYVNVPVTFDDQGDIFPVILVAGSVGIAWSHKEQSDDHRRRRMPNTVQPISGWWMFEKISQEPIDVRIRKPNDDSEIHYQSQLGEIRKGRDITEAKKTIDAQAVIKAGEYRGGGGYRYRSRRSFPGGRAYGGSSSRGTFYRT